MSDTTRPPQGPSAEQRLSQVIIVLIAVVACAAALITYLQFDAAGRDDRANRDTRLYASQVMGRKVSGDARVNLDYHTIYQQWLELDLLSDSATARGDDAAARRYLAVRDRLVSLSPMLATKYFDRETGEVNVTRYEAETYLTEVAALSERFLAASTVKDAWDLKANTYIIHLTLCAVSLALLGLASTLTGVTARSILTGTGLLIALVAIGWATTVWLRPVLDLRERTGAIEAYARGEGLAHQARWQEAITAYDEAIALAPTYARAFSQRAEAQAGLANVAAATADYERARAAGDARGVVAGSLAFSYYLQGRFAEATTTSRAALEASPNEMWIRFDLGLGLLADGQIDAAQATYSEALALATKQVTEARTAGREPPSWLWWSLDDGAQQLDNLLQTLASGQGQPPRAAITKPDQVRPVAEGLVRQLKSLAVALEFTGQPPAGTLTATIQPLVFGQPTYDAAGAVTGLQPASSFVSSADGIAMQVDFAGMSDGQEVIVKVYLDNEEDSSLRSVNPWRAGSSGTTYYIIDHAVTDTFVLAPGDYRVELYVASHLAQRGVFTVTPSS